MHFAVLQFPASNCDQDCVHAVQVLGHTAELVWHKDTSLGAASAVIIPGGFSYGDYLRCGAIARFSPIMAQVEDLPDLASLAARWQSFVAGQTLDDIDPELVTRTGNQYLESAIDRAIDTGTE